MSSHDVLAEALTRQDGGTSLAGQCVRDGNSFRFDGERPGPDWYAHGWFERRLVLFAGAALPVVVLRKRRWRRIGTNTTCHSRPASDPAAAKFCSLIMLLRIWAWLASDAGFHKRVDVSAELGEAGSDRSVQRWVARAKQNALWIQQAIRQAILALQRVEPRPQEDLFRKERAPPAGLVRRNYRSAVATTTLWRALDMLFVAAKQHSLCVARLVAEARRRWLTEFDIFPL